MIFSLLATPGYAQLSWLTSCLPGFRRVDGTIPKPLPVASGESSSQTSHERQTALLGLQARLAELKAGNGDLVEISRELIPLLEKFPGDRELAKRAAELLVEADRGPFRQQLYRGTQEEKDRASRDHFKALGLLRESPAGDLRKQLLAARGESDYLLGVLIGVGRKETPESKKADGEKLATSKARKLISLLEAKRAAILDGFGRKGNATTARFGSLDHEITAALTEAAEDPHSLFLAARRIAMLPEGPDRRRLEALVRGQRVDSVNGRDLLDIATALEKGTPLAFPKGIDFRFRCIVGEMISGLAQKDLTSLLGSHGIRGVDLSHGGTMRWDTTVGEWVLIPEPAMIENLLGGDYFLVVNGTAADAYRALSGRLENSGERAKIVADLRASGNGALADRVAGGAEKIPAVLDYSEIHRGGTNLIDQDMPQILNFLLVDQIRRGNVPRIMGR